jgi:type I restriction enzyme S subunit
LFTCIGSTIGKSGISKVALSSNQQINAIFPSVSYSSDFLFYYLNFISPKIKSLASEQAVPMINKTEFGKTKIAIPNRISEQAAIATALSDMDELIAQTEKLIEKKKAIKQGVMQELLRPKEGWVENEIGKIGEITGSGVDKKINEDEILVRLVNYMDVYRRDFIYSYELSHWVTAPVQKKEHCNVKQGDIFFTPSSETRTDIALSAVAMDNIDDAVYSYHLVRFRISENWDLKFRAYIFNTRKFLQQVESLCEGGGKRYVLTLPKFRALKVHYPLSKTEQARIGQILWDIDSQVWNYETKLQKLKLQKKGMMQSLLTGKIRIF